MSGTNHNVKVVAQNRQARHNYFIEYVIEAGIQLVGTEVKSVRQSKINLKDSYATVKNGEIIARGIYIGPYEKGNIYNVEPTRDRKLLLHRHEINKLIGLVKQKGVSLIPIKVYIKGRLVKIELGICTGKTLYDKRQSIAKRDAGIEMRRSLKESYK